MSNAQARDVRPHCPSEPFLMFPVVSEGCMETKWRGIPARELFLAAYEGRPDDLRELLQDPELKAHVNDYDGDKFNILHGYALSGEDCFAEDIIGILLDAGMNINDKTKSTQETPLLIATHNRRAKMVKTLLKYGAKYNISDWSGSNPIEKANTRCCHNGKGKEGCCEILNMLLHAQEQTKSNKQLQQRAGKVRNEGNKQFAKGNFEKARALYSKSIEIYEDHRSFSNRALCCIQIGRKILQDNDGLHKLIIHEWGEEAERDAYKASVLEPTFAKAYYREAIGKLMARDLPRTKQIVRRGLAAVPGNTDLLRLLRQLEDLNVPDEVACRTRRVQPGEPFDCCEFCRLKNPLPIGDVCIKCNMPWCSFDDDRAPEFDMIVRSMIMSS